MRIVGGTAGGRSLRTPKGRSTRPTADRVKESLFSILAERCPGARVLDLFAGTGALGLEALSRGAQSAVMVDSDPGCADIIATNLAATGLSGGEVHRAEATRALEALHRRARTFDLVFLDPPYGQGLEVNALALLLRHGLLAPGALVVVEHSSRLDVEPLATGFQKQRTTTYGDTALSFFVEVKT